MPNSSRRTTRTDPEGTEHSLVTQEPLIADGHQSLTQFSQQKEVTAFFCFFVFMSDRPRPSPGEASFYLAFPNIAIAFVPQPYDSKAPLSPPYSTPGSLMKTPLSSEYKKGHGILTLTINDEVFAGVYARASQTRFILSYIRDSFPVLLQISTTCPKT